jgi:hypothetical protein
LIGGEGVTRGYLNRPELTEERFVPNPFRPGGRLYRTGDLARYLADGNIEFLGRADQQVKIRGFRIELGEIEAVLRACPGVRDAVVAMREITAGEKSLVAYAVPESAGGISDERMRSVMRAALPDYMMPAAFVELEALPLTHNGKIDRKALPHPDRASRSPARSYAPPRNGLEQTIATVWREALNLEQVGLADNFFDLGGHSILAVQVHHKLNEVLDRRISLIDIFRFPTVSALAAHLGADAPEPASVGQGVDRAEARRQAMQRRRILQN